MESHTSERKRYSTVNTAGPRRNGMPGVRPYVYKGDGTGMTEAEVQERIATARAQIAQRPHPALDIDHAMPPFEPFTPGPEWYRELADGDVPGVAALAKVLNPPAPEVPAPRPAPRCRKCGYLRTRCACGGAR